MTQPIRWGILSTGSIAHAFASAIQYMPDADAVLTAVGSRTQHKADAFGAQYDIPNRHASYDALANDPAVDVIYIATPHIFHHENMLLCLNAGKHVLCEKAFTINAHEAEAAINLARQKNLFLMEAMWTRFIPAIQQLREWVQAGKIGEVQHIRANFHHHLGYDPSSRIFDPALGGGALLDLGIYPLSFTSMLLGSPQRIRSEVKLAPTGVDELASLLLGYDSGAQAALSFGTLTSTPIDAAVLGSAGTIYVHPRFLHSERLTFYPAHGDPETLDVPFEHNGYQYEAHEVGRCIRAGKLESATMPLDETLALMRQMDAIRTDWGVTYPTET
jgi:dihydrodiol dehydrogenase / D-xylose 1-dehydrogenase (NADP)